MEKNIVIIRGDTFAFGMKFNDLGQDLTEAHFLVSDTFNSPYKIHLTIGNGITLVESSGDDRTYRVMATPSQTYLTSGAGVYNYSCKVKIGTSEYTILHGKATFVDVVEEGA